LRREKKWLDTKVAPVWIGIYCGIKGQRPKKTLINFKKLCRNSLKRINRWLSEDRKTSSGEQIASD
jgi:hypothetical protein